MAESLSPYEPRPEFTPPPLRTPLVAQVAYWEHGGHGYWYVAPLGTPWPSDAWLEIGSLVDVAVFLGVA